MKRVSRRSWSAGNKPVLGLLLSALPYLGWAQCSCTQTLDAAPAYQGVVTVSAGTLCIKAGVTLQNATIHVTGSNVTICNQGTIGDNYSGNGYGVIEVDRGLRGVTINNLGTINRQPSSPELDQQGPYAKALQGVRS